MPDFSLLKKTQVRFNPNAFAFEVKRRSVLGKTHLRFVTNARTFFYACFSGLKKPCFQTSSAPMMSRTELYP